MDRLRFVPAVLAGLLVAIALVLGGDALVHHLWPPPLGLDARIGEQVRALMGGMPAAAFALLALGWGVASAAGAWVAVRIAPERAVRAGRIVALVVLAGTIMNLRVLPHPTWLWPVAIILVLAGGWGGAMAARPRVP